MAVPAQVRRLVVAVLALLGAGQCSSSDDGPAVLPQLSLPGSPALVIALAGDTHGHDIVVEETSPDPLAPLDPLFALADVFVFNHEGVLQATDPGGAGCAPQPDQSILSCLPRAADFLARTPLAVATLANNHVLDCGPDALVETRSALRARGVETVGAGLDLDEATAPVWLTAGGLRVVVIARHAMEPDPVAAGPGVPGAAPWDPEADAQVLADLHAQADLVLVALHLHLAAGWTDRTAPEHRAVVEQALDAGADLVVAHGPHVPQGVLVRNGGLALLSLGNFLFDPGYAMVAPAYRSVLALVAVHPDRLDLALVPLRLDPGGRPGPVTARDGASILAHLAELSSATGARLEMRDGAAWLSVARPARG